MKLYLLRHGIAEDAHGGMRDEQRQLTPEGRRKLKEVMRVARASGVQPSMILSSPLVRAVQTAAIAAEELNYDGAMPQLDSLIPEAAASQAWEEIRVHRDESELLLASHNPLCSSLAGFLLGAPDLQIDFKKGGMMRIDLESFGPRPRGILRWYLVPSLAS